MTHWLDYFRETWVVTWNTMDLQEQENSKNSSVKALTIMQMNLFMWLHFFNASSCYCYKLNMIYRVRTVNPDNFDTETVNKWVKRKTWKCSDFKSKALVFQKYKRFCEINSMMFDFWWKCWEWSIGAPPTLKAIGSCWWCFLQWSSTLADG